MSVERFFSTSESQQRLRAGPLRRAIDGFAAWLAIEGYAYRSAAAKLRFVGNLSRWLEREELGVEALDDQRVEAFLLARGPTSGRGGKATTGRQLLCYLRGSGVIPAAVSRPCSDAPIERIQRTYERFLVDERGVSPATVTNYLPIVRASLAEHFGSREVALEMLGVRIAAYRDTLKLLLRFLAASMHRSAAALHVEDLTPDRILAFLDDLETVRRNTIRTRNARLAAIHSFFRYVLDSEPALALPCQRVLAIPVK